MVTKEQKLAPALCVALESVGKEDIELVGGKGAGLGEMMRSGIPVPPGFVVTTTAFKQFMQASELDEVVEGVLAPLDIHNPMDLDYAAQQIQNVILGAQMPRALAGMIKRMYLDMGAGPVAVRSSATAEDLPDASFAGQQRTYLNVEGSANVVKAVQGCWASLFEARAIFYREENGFAHRDVYIAVPVQRMVPSDVSGVMFTVDPTTGNRDTVLIEAVYGLGETLVSGELSPDSYQVSRAEMRVTQRELAEQSWLLRRNSDGDGLESGSVQVPVPESDRLRYKLEDGQVLALARMGLKLEEHYGAPQDVEWAMSEGELFIVQSRPITTLDKGVQVPVDDDSSPFTTSLEGLKVLLKGASASPGVAYGPVRIIRSPKEIHLVKQGDILVTEMTTPDFVPAMKRAAAIVTDRGGRTCHAAIVSRELGLPCIVGTGNATEVLKDIAAVTVDGKAGLVHVGDLRSKLGNGRTAANAGPRIATKTKLYVNLADPDAAERIAKLDIDGVGLLRMEFMAAHIGEHPRAMLEDGRGDEFVARLADGLETFAAAFGSRPVVLRFSDFKTNEYRNLKGGEAFEPHEENPMIGYRGCSRYLTEPDLFALEVRAVKQVRERHPNLWVMVPFVRTVEELQGVKALMEKQGLVRGPDFKLWMMLEVPSNVILLEDFLAAGVDGVSIGSNDLTQLTLGVDRDNERMAALFDERNPAILKSLERIVTGCVKAGVTASICGQAPSVFPELTRSLVSWGITSISVSPDMIDETRRIMAEAERPLGLENR